MCVVPCLLTNPAWRHPIAQCGVTIVQQWCYRGATVVLQWYYLALRVSLADVTDVVLDVGFHRHLCVCVCVCVCV
jgi:hypothetical protein